MIPAWEKGGPATRRKGMWPNLSIGSPDTSMVLASAMQAPESSKDLLNLKIHRHGPRTLSCSRKMTTQLFRLKWGWRSSFASERPQSGGEYALPLGRFTGPTTCAIFELQDFPVDFDYQWGGPETWQWAENERGWLWMHRPTGRRPGCRGKNVIRWTTHAPPGKHQIQCCTLGCAGCRFPFSKLVGHHQMIMGWAFLRDMIDSVGWICNGLLWGTLLFWITPEMSTKRGWKKWDIPGTPRVIFRSLGEVGCLVMMRGSNEGGCGV